MMSPLSFSLYTHFEAHNGELFFLLSVNNYLVFGNIKDDLTLGFVCKLGSTSSSGTLSVTGSRIYIISMYSSGGLDYQEVLNFDRLDGNLEAKRYMQTWTRVKFTEFTDLGLGVAVQTSESFAWQVDVVKYVLEASCVYCADSFVVWRVNLTGRNVEAAGIGVLSDLSGAHTLLFDSLA